MDARSPKRRSLRVPIAWKFFLLLAIFVPSGVGVAWVGESSLAAMHARLDALYDDNLRSTQAVGHLSAAIEEAEEMALRLVGGSNANANAHVQSELREEVIPKVEGRLLDVRRITGFEDRTDARLVKQLETSWRKFLALLNSPEFLAASSGQQDHQAATTAKVETLGEVVLANVTAIDAREGRQAAQGRLQAERTYSRSLLWFRVIVGLGLLLGIAATLALIRTVLFG